MDGEYAEQDEPVARIYRTNGAVWALFLRYADGIEEPDEIFSSAFAMLADAAKYHRRVIEL